MRSIFPWTGAGKWCWAAKESEGSVSAPASRGAAWPELPLLVDVSHTSRCTSPTGVQRVARAVCLELERQGLALPVAFDRWRGDWRVLAPEERSTLDSPRHGGLRQRIRPLDAIRGAASRVLPALDAPQRIPPGCYGGLLVVEKLESRRTGEITLLRPRLSGPSVAVVHDLIPVKFPHFATRRSLREFGGYLDTLHCYDGVAAVSEASRRDLLGYWANRGVRTPPPVTVIAPATDPVAETSRPWSGGDRPPVVLMVATLEPRKNQLTVLEACEALWRSGMQFVLRLIGRRRSGGDEAAARVATLRAKGRPVEWLGHVSDETLADAYAECRFTLCPSLYEGYGLPVVESLRRLRPCIVSARGALREVSAGGGCLVLAKPEADPLSAAILRLLEDEDCYRNLVTECERRQYRNWSDYVDDLGAWLRSLSRRGA